MEIEHNTTLIGIDDFLFYNILEINKMIKVLLLLLSITLALSQQASDCKICPYVKQCDSSLFTDPYVDPLYESIIKSVNISRNNYPNHISKVQNAA